MSFFAGDLDGTNAHDDLARKIADRGRDWVKNSWRLEDAQACEFTAAHAISLSCFNDAQIVRLRLALLCSLTSRRLPTPA